MPNRTMTDLQILAHMEQMEAARAEFNRSFKPIAENLRQMGFNEKEIIQRQIAAWAVFRKEKGLRVV